MSGLSFLNSVFLWGLGAAALPIIIHLIKRNRAIKIHFAAMRFLETDPTKKFRSQRLKQLLLLLMRIAAMAILVLAFARPFLNDHESAAFWGTQARAAVILVDNSYSMAVGDNFKAAIQEAKKLLGNFSPRDQVTVIQFAQKSQIVAQKEMNFDVIAGQLEHLLQLSNESTDYLQALQTAESILMESALGEKHIYLISDFQKVGWEHLNPHWTIQEGIAVNFVPISSVMQDNLALQDVLIVRPKRTQRSADLLAKVKNFGPVKKNVKVVLHINGKKKAQRQVAIADGEETVVKFKRVVLPKGLVHGSVELSGQEDALQVDDSYHFVLQDDASSNILAVNGEATEKADQDELFFLDRAINLPKVAKFHLKETSAQQFRKHELSKYRAVVLANLKDLPRKDVERLVFYVRNGGGLVLALGDKVNPNIFNSLFQDLAPAKINNLAFESVQLDNSVILAEIDYQHSVFQPFAESGQGDLSIARFYQYYHVTPFKEEAVLARFDDGGAAILERQVGDGRVLLLTSTIDNEWNNLPVKAMYLPLIYQALNYVSAERKGRESFLVGQSIALHGYQVAAGDKLFIELPSGAVMQTDAEFFEDTTEPGLYRLFKEGRKKSLASFAVNVNSSESDLEVLQPEALQTAAAQVTSQAPQTASIGLDTFALQQEQAQKLWRLAILATILLLIAETWLGNRTYR